VDLPDILTADNAVLEHQLAVLSPSDDVSVERWRREARAELTRRHWTRVETSGTARP
jgi:hypothetical protein